jgi:hypothetical protein
MISGNTTITKQILTTDIINKNKQKFIDPIIINDESYISPRYEFSSDQISSITVWERLDPKTSTWVHNHIETNIQETDKPLGTLDQQKSWDKSTWKRLYAYLDSKQVVHLF